MERFLLMSLVLATVFSCGTPSYAANRYTTSTTDAVIASGPRVLCGVLADTGGTNALIVDLYDNAAAASGSQPVPSMRLAGSDNYGGMMLGGGVNMANGIYLDVTTDGGATVTVISDPSSCR